MAGRQILDWTAGGFGLAQRGFLELGGQALGVGTEVLEEHLSVPEQAFETIDERKLTDSSAQDEAIEAG